MSEVLYELADHIAVITINRPEQHNTMNSALREQLFSAWHRFEADPEARVAILTASGDKAFCAGRDLRDPEQANMAKLERGYLPILGDSASVTKPTIAAVNGPAFALGFIFVQMCDLCVACDDATFAITEVRMGRGVPWSVPLASMLPRKVMAELLLTGNPMSAERAHELGLVNHVVPRSQLMAKATELAATIAGAAPLAVKAALQIMQVSDQYPLDQALDQAYAATEPVYASEDALEGIRAFQEKRKPVWKGR